MAGRGGRGERKPQATSSSSRGQKAWVPRAPGGERSSEFQKEDPYSSSTSVSSKKTPQQMGTPVQTLKSVDSPSQIVTPVQPTKSADSPPQMVTPVQPPATSSSSRGGKAEHPPPSAAATPPMAGGADKRNPASSSRGQKAWVPRAPGRERSSESQKDGPRSSSPSVGSKKSPLQTVTPVQPPRSADSPPQVVTPDQSPKSADSAWQMVTPVKPVQSIDSLPQMVTPVQSPKSADSPWQMVTPVRPQKSVDSPPQMVTPVQPPKSVDLAPQMVTPVQLQESPDLALQFGALFQPPKSLDSRSTSCGSGAVVSDSRADPFDICRGESKSSVEVQPSLLEVNREKRRARELSKSAAALQHLRPGMVLLKNFLKPEDQVKIIKQCRDLGVGTGGFYQPSYRDGAKLSLRMMCLGKKNWDPDSCYGDIRPFDGAQPLKMPEELTKFVNDAIEASHAFLKQSGQGKSNPKKEIPPMSPDICIVNFYTTAGKLGLHQDKDETIDSLVKRLPVVSFSLGDTAEFLYGDTRDETKASKVKLESGDVLIFGGQSRHIFHGVSSITPKTAPTYVTKEANLRPGRLNLTFRQY